MPKVLLIYTGGTIGMSRNKHTGALQPLDFEQLSAAIPELELLPCAIETHSLPNPIDSSNMTPEIWVELANIIYKNYHVYDGFVVLHGSDTMAYTGSALSFMLEGLQKPVIFTGSQLPIGILRSDARENLISAVELAIARGPNGQSMITEVAVYFEYKLYRANRVFKNSSEHFEAFSSPNYPWLAEMGVQMKMNENYLYRQNNSKLILHEQLNTDVAVVPIFPGFNEKIIYSTAQSGISSLILRTFGAGNAPQKPSFLEAIKHCISNGIHVINVSQCRKGSVDQSKYAAGKSLLELGVIEGKDITLEAAITKLMFLQGKAYSASEISSLFPKNLRGEISE